MIGLTVHIKEAWHQGYVPLTNVLPDSVSSVGGPAHVCLSLSLTVCVPQIKRCQLVTTTRIEILVCKFNNCCGFFFFFAVMQLAFTSNLYI